MMAHGFDFLKTKALATPPANSATRSCKLTPIVDRKSLSILDLTDRTCQQEQITHRNTVQLYCKMLWEQSTCYEARGLQLVAEPAVGILPVPTPQESNQG